MKTQRIGWAIAALLGLFLLAACAPAEAPAAPPATSLSPAWDTPLTLGNAAHLEAPALGCGTGGWAAAWPNGPALIFRAITAEGAAQPEQRLEPGNRAPWDITLLPGPDGSWHLLWLDLDALGQRRLYSALLAADGTLLRGPLPLAPDPVDAFSAAPGDAGTAVVVWAGGGPRAALYGQRLDSQGRPNAGGPQPITPQDAVNVAWPRLVRDADGAWWLSWLAQAGESLDAGPTAFVLHSTAPFPWETGGQPRALGTVEADPISGYIEQVALGLDRTHGYLFITHQDAATQAAHTELLAFAMDPTGGVQRSQLALPGSTEGLSADFETGFNGGAGLTLPATDEAEAMELAWPAPLRAQYAVLPVAFVAGDQVVVAYFQGGALAAYQPIAPAQVGGRLALCSDRARHLSLSWAALPGTADENAAFLLSSTNPALRAGVESAASPTPTP